ncbi:hypothetical protein C8J56DRAFT_568545 [Mycena floridula]|nr:hypothetical protein C8J56DRAFT_568545 [Mycena floridula]
MLFNSNIVLRLFSESVPSLKELYIDQVYLESRRDLPFPSLSPEALPNLRTLRCPPCLSQKTDLLTKIYLISETICLKKTDFMLQHGTVRWFAKTLEDLVVRLKHILPLHSETFPILKHLTIEHYSPAEDRNTEFVVSQMRSLPQLPSLERLSFPISTTSSLESPTDFPVSQTAV